MNHVHQTAQKGSNCFVHAEFHSLFRLHTRVSGNTGTAIILQDTSTNISSDDPQESIDYIKSGLQSISNETINNYMERNAQPGQLSLDMDLGVDYVLLSTDELSAIMGQRMDGPF